MTLRPPAEGAAPCGASAVASARAISAVCAQRAQARCAFRAHVRAPTDSSSDGARSRVRAACRELAAVLATLQLAAQNRCAQCRCARITPTLTPPTTSRTEPRSVEPGAQEQGGPWARMRRCVGVCTCGAQLRPLLPFGREAHPLRGARAASCADGVLALRNSGGRKPRRRTAVPGAQARCAFPCRVRALHSTGGGFGTRAAARAG